MPHRQGWHAGCERHACQLGCKGKGKGSWQQRPQRLRVASASDSLADLREDAERVVDRALGLLQHVVARAAQHDRAGLRARQIKLLEYSSS